MGEHDDSGITSGNTSGNTEAEILVRAAIARTEAWLATLGISPVLRDEASRLDQRASRPDLLDAAADDADSFAFTRRLLEAVAGGSDHFAAALELRDASRDLPRSMPAFERFAVKAGGLASLGMPWAVLPAARTWLRERVSHLVVAADTWSPEGNEPPTLLALTCAEIAGDAAAQQELDRLASLAAQPGVTHLAVDVARIVPGGLAGDWALDHEAKRGAEALTRVLAVAQQHDTVVILESSDYRSSLLAAHMLAQALSDRDLAHARTGISLAAELPESLQTAEAIIQLSRARVLAGHMPIEVTVRVAGIAGGEQIASILSGLPVATIDGDLEQTAQWIRLVTLLLANSDVVRTVAASDDPLLLALTTQIAEGHAGERTRDVLTLQVRAGVATSLETALTEHGFTVRRRLPLAPKSGFAGVVEYLIALAADTLDADSVLTHTRALLAADPGALQQSAARLDEALQSAMQPAPESHRVQHRALEWSDEARHTSAYYRDPTQAVTVATAGLTAAVLSLTRAHTGELTLELAGPLQRVPVISATGFANEPVTDASSFENREWAKNALVRARESDIGLESVLRAQADARSLETVVTRAGEASQQWREVRPAERGRQVTGLALAIAAARERLIEAQVAESGAPLSLIDTDISGAIDAARYLGQLAHGLGAVRGAQFVPDRVAVVVADAGSSLRDRTEAMLAMVAAGAAVVLIADQAVARSSAILIDVAQTAGLAAGLITLLVPENGSGSSAEGAMTELATQVIADPLVDRATVLGSRDTATALLRRRPDLPVLGRFVAAGVAVITGTADPIAAARHVVRSAFGAGHTDPSVARAVVLVGSAGRSETLRAALADAVSSLEAGNTAKPRGADPRAFAVGPLPRPLTEAQLRTLTHLEPGEEWVVRPVPLDDEKLLWRPGLRFGVSKSSPFWNDAASLPVIGVTSVHTMSEAIALTNRVGAGGVAALHATDPAETIPWLERTDAAMLSLGRATTDVRVERQPWGGWRQAGMGGVALAGGPNRLFTLGSWQLREGTASQTLHLRGLSPEVQVLIETAQASLDYQSFDRVRRA
ncbi:MAG: aldehyde dehydrogenase family protein, partial [Microbacteriaceae bacterium]|nr:aldehyde dehydrogenase family protein [Microbacteriaceae bacterium]